MGTRKCFMVLAGMAVLAALSGCGGEGGTGTAAPAGAERWADFSALGLDRKALKALFGRAHFHAFEGSAFDTHENLCVRINVACPSRFLEPAVRRLAEAAKEEGCL